MGIQDPMGFARNLDCAGDYFPLGFPIHLSTNSGLVVQAAAGSWATFAQRFHTPPLEIQVVVDEDLKGDVAVQTPQYRGREHLLVIAGGQDYAVCDHARGFAFCRLSATTAQHTAFIAYYYLEALVLHLLTQRYLTPLHAACLSRHGTGVLLCGDSGAGKSSLAYACAKNAWCYVSDNESWLVRDHDGAPLILGTPTRIRFRDSAAELFPELLAQQPYLFANGKMSLSLELNGRPELQSSPCAGVSHLVFLDRGGDTTQAAGVYRVAKDDAFEQLLRSVPAYSPQVREQHAASLRRLVGSTNTARLKYRELPQAIELLDELVSGS